MKINLKYRNVIVLSALLISVLIYFRICKNSKDCQPDNEKLNKTILTSTHGDEGNENVRRKPSRDATTSLNANQALVKFLAQWDACDSEGRSSTEVRILRHLLIPALVQHGYTPDQVYSLIAESYEFGDNRKVLIANLFFYLTPDQSLVLFKKLQVDERKVALTGMVSPALKVSNISEYLKGLTLTKDEEDLFYRKYLDSYYMHLYRNQSLALKDAVTEVLKIPASEQIKNQFLIQALKDDPFDVYAIAKEDINLLNISAFDIVSAMLFKDPERAREAALSNEALTSELKNVSAHMLATENANFVKWYEENKANLKAEQIDYIEAGIAKHLSDNNQIQDAWDQLDQITDPIIKKKAEGQIWAKERNMVQNAVKAEPQKALEELVSGTSVHDSYWIEEAMDVWLKKDFESAEQWYQQNWKTLPKEKAQYAAASFARQAIQAGDIDAALQWMPYIQDAKTKARIERQLTEAQQ